jgi:putative acetyltransferase
MSRPGDMSTRSRVVVGPVGVHDAEVLALVDALTADLAGGGYTAEETFGYSAEQLAASGVHLLGARVAGALAGIGGVELQDDGQAELKRFYVVPAHRGSGVADAIMDALMRHALSRGVRVLLLETGNQQHAAMRFYRRHGFTEIPRFGAYVGSATSVCMRRDLPGD